MDKNTGWSQHFSATEDCLIFPANCCWLCSIDLQGTFRCMYSKRSNYAPVLASGSSSILIPGLPFSFTSFMSLILPRLNNQACRVGGKKKQHQVIYTSLPQVKMIGDNINWKGDG